MKSKDLRIGNSVEDYNGKIISIMPNDILGLYQMEIAGKDNVIYFPIELNEDSISLFNLIKSEQGWFYIVLHKNFGTVSLSVNKNRRVVIQINQDGVGATHTINHINYVHELQNLYFSLTGIELEFKKCDGF